MSIFKEENRRNAMSEYEKKRMQEVLKRYNEDIERNKKIIKPFGQIVEDILGDDTYQQFEYKTGLSPNMFYELKKRIGKDNQCQKNTIVSLCVGYDLGLQIANELFCSEGSGLNPHSDRDLAYVMLLTEFRGKSIDECNEILEMLKIKPRDRLGTYARKQQL